MNTTRHNFTLSVELTLNLQKDNIFPKTHYPPTSM